MTTVTEQKIEVARAESDEVTKVLHQSYRLWSAGMSKSQYFEWTSRQLVHPWAKRNFRFLVARKDNEIVSSCKVYSLEMRARGKSFRVAGIGAVFTMPRHRGRGFASAMLDDIVDTLEDENFDAALLFSDIDCHFYEQFGFEELSDHEFYVWTKDPLVEHRIMHDPGFAEDLQGYSADVALLEPGDIPDMVRHHMRYLPTLPYGLARDELYWSFKIDREQFLQNSSSFDRPALELMSIDFGSNRGGYAVFEQSGKIMRVLEVVGNPEIREILWRDLLRNALLRRVHLIRGWESAAPAFLRGLTYVERDAAQPMLLCLNEETEPWLDQLPCPLLELDHF